MGMDMKKQVISKKTIQVGDKSYIEEKYWPLFPSNRIITTRRRKITLGEVFSFMEMMLISLCGVYLIWFLFKFSSAMSAWSDLHSLMLGY